MISEILKMVGVPLTEEQEEKLEILEKRTYEPKKLPIAFGEACNAMWERLMIDSTPIMMVWGRQDVTGYEIEVIMRRIEGVPPKPPQVEK